MGAPFLTVGFLPSRFRVPNIKSGARIEDRRSLMRSVKQSPFASNLTMNPLASKDYDGWHTQFRARKTFRIDKLVEIRFLSLSGR